MHSWKTLVYMFQYNREISLEYVKPSCFKLVLSHSSWWCLVLASAVLMWELRPTKTGFTAVVLPGNALYVPVHLCFDCVISGFYMVFWAHAQKNKINQIPCMPKDIRVFGLNLFKAQNPSLSLVLLLQIFLFFYSKHGLVMATKD